MPKVELTRSQVEVLASHLENQKIYSYDLANVLKTLPDSKAGKGELSRDFGVYCVRCDEQIEQEDYIVKYGKFVHTKCVEGYEDPKEAQTHG